MLTSNVGKAIGLALGFGLLLLMFALSVRVGPIPLSFHDLYEAYIQYDDTVSEHVVVYNRLSRAVTAAVIGSALAVAGCLLQALTQNPLASPSLLGLNAGALFFVVVAISFLAISSLPVLMVFAFIGAGVAAACVLLLSSLGKHSLSPLRIVLAGTAMTALFSSFAQGVLVLNEANLDQMLRWMAGTVSGRSLEVLFPILPFFAIGFVVALFLAHSINLLVLGKDVTRGLGQNITLVRIVIVLVAILLAGGAVAIGGMIGFIGLIVPHMARALVGNDHRWLLPNSMWMGASLLIGADLLARFVIRPEELPIGIITAFLGAPFFFYLARKGMKGR